MPPQTENDNIIRKPYTDDAYGLPYPKIAGRANTRGCLHPDFSALGMSAGKLVADAENDGRAGGCARNGVDVQGPATRPMGRGKYVSRRAETSANPTRMRREGFEPTNSLRADLESVSVGHLDTFAFVPSLLYYLRFCTFAFVPALAYSPELPKMVRMTSITKKEAATTLYPARMQTIAAPANIRTNLA